MRLVVFLFWSFCWIAFANAIDVENGVVTQQVEFITEDAAEVPITGADPNGFTVILRLDGGAAITDTSPTMVEHDAVNEPGRWSYTLDQGTTLPTGVDYAPLTIQISHSDPLIKVKRKVRNVVRPPRNEPQTYFRTVEWTIPVLIGALDDSWAVEFRVVDSNGNWVDADSLPAITMTRSGGTTTHSDLSLDTPAVEDIGVGLYRITGTGVATVGIVEEVFYTFIVNYQLDGDEFWITQTVRFGNDRSFSAASDSFAVKDKLPGGGQLIAGVDDATFFDPNNIFNVPLEDFTDPNTAGQALNWLLNAFISDGVLASSALVNVPISSGEGAAILKADVAGMKDDQVLSIVQGGAITLTMVITAQGSFDAASPTSITLKIADSQTVPTVVNIANVDVTRLCEDLEIQVFRFTLSAVDTATLAEGFISMEVTIDSQKVQMKKNLKIVEGL